MASLLLWKNWDGKGHFCCVWQLVLTLRYVRSCAYTLYRVALVFKKLLIKHNGCKFLLTRVRWVVRFSSGVTSSFQGCDTLLSSHPADSLTLKMHVGVSKSREMVAQWHEHTCQKTWIVRNDASRLAQDEMSLLLVGPKFGTELKIHARRVDW